MNENLFQPLFIFIKKKFQETLRLCIEINVMENGNRKNIYSPCVDSRICTMDEMKDNQSWFDFVLHEIIWFISQSHIHRRRRWVGWKFSSFLFSPDSDAKLETHITFHSRIDKFDYFYARAMINFSSIIWYSFNCMIVGCRRERKSCRWNTK